MFVTTTKHILEAETKLVAIFWWFLPFVFFKGLKSAGFPHTKFLFSKNCVSFSESRQIFPDQERLPIMFSDTSSWCKLSSEKNGVIIGHIDPSILHKTLAKTKFSNLVLVQNANFEVSNVCQNVQKWLFLKVKIFFEAV